MVAPWNAFWNSNPGVDFTFSNLPFVRVTTNNVNYPYLGTAAQNPNAPFADQYSLTSTFALDVCKVSFQNTENALNVKGRLETSIFY